MKKRMTALILALITAFSVAAAIPAAAQDVIKPGDFTGDGAINAKDVTALMKAIIADSAADNAAADFNGDGKVNAKDVIALMKHIIGALPEWSRVYKEFVLNEKFLHISELTFYNYEGKTDENFVFALKDISGDGVPELFVKDRSAYMAIATIYVFTVEDGSVKYVGRTGARESWIESDPYDKYQGVFSIYNHMGGLSAFYSEMNGSILIHEDVLDATFFDSAATQAYETIYNYAGTPEYFLKNTDNLELYECVKHMIDVDYEPIWIPRFSLGEIRSQGWEVFAATAQ